MEQAGYVCVHRSVLGGAVSCGGASSCACGGGGLRSAGLGSHGDHVLVCSCPCASQVITATQWQYAPRPRILCGHGHDFVTVVFDCRSFAWLFVGWGGGGGFGDCGRSLSRRLSWRRSVPVSNDGRSCCVCDASGRTLITRRSPSFVSSVGSHRRWERRSLL